MNIESNKSVSVDEAVTESPLDEAVTESEAPVPAAAQVVAARAETVRTVRTTR